MLKLVIVDDEKIVREGLCKFVDWASLGYEVIQTLASAEETIDYVKENRVDAVLTDILMDEKNGIELVRETSKFNDQIKFVLLSGQGEFAYAKEAFKLGVFDYLTKPVNFDELKTTFTKLSDVIKKEQFTLLHHENYREARIEQLLNNLVSNEYHPQELQREELHYLFHDKEFQIARIYIENLLPEHREKLKATFRTWLQEAPDTYVFKNRLSEYALYVHTNSKDELTVRLHDAIENIKKDQGLIVFAGIGGRYSCVSAVSRSYREAGEALAYRYYFPEKNVMDYAMVHHETIPSGAREKMVSFIIHDDIEGLKRYLHGLIEINTKVNSMDKGTYYHIGIEFLKVYKEFLESRSRSDLISLEDEVRFVYEVLEKQSATEVWEYLENYINQLTYLISQHSPNAVVDNVKKYIHDHYGDVLSLNVLAEVVYVHPAYLSTMFKEKTGENVLHYISRTRVEKAKALLKDLSLRIYDVSSMVGYESSKHFTKVFKSFTGATPTEYRNQSVPSF